jgi:hypothetical protein
MRMAGRIGRAGMSPVVNHLASLVSTWSPPGLPLSGRAWKHTANGWRTGMAVTAAALVVVPLFAVAKRSLRPGSASARRWSVMASRWVVWPCTEDGHRS